MHAIEQLAEFSVRHSEGSLPETVKTSCALLITDLLGAVAAGLDSQLATAARSAASAAFGSGPVNVWLTGEQLSIAGAAMANSAAASALDIDDGHRGAAGHPGAGIIPASLAVAQALSSTDDAIFDAIAIGYDVGLRVATSRPTPTIETYFSGRWITYGAAAAVGRLLRLDTTQMANALAIAGAEGPVVFRKGTSRYQGSTVKEAIPPAVVVGVTAAFRAKAGATGPLDLLDNNDLYTRSVLTGELGDRWWLQDCYLKPYACCRYMHAAIDAILRIRRKNKPVVSLRIETFQRGTELTNERAPRTLEGAQYSYYFSCALAALHGGEALQPIDPKMLVDAQVLDLASRIELVAHHDFAGSFPKSTPCRVILDQGEGPEDETVLSPLGDVGNPMNRHQVTEKFRRIGAGTLDRQHQDSLLSALESLTSKGFRPLLSILGGASMTSQPEITGELV